MKVNYDELANKYDVVRKEDTSTIRRFIDEISFSKEINVLDFGCGTGNFTCALKMITEANVFGVEPSDGMRLKAIEKALMKGIDIIFKKGDHSDIPFENDFFEFIYMTDVIHHVPDIDMMFKEMHRVLRPGGYICIVTESHKQIESRFWVKYFPTTVGVEKNRYLDIPQIIESGKRNGLVLLREDTTDGYKKHQISPDFLRLV